MLPSSNLMMGFWLGESMGGLVRSNTIGIYPVLKPFRDALMNQVL